MYSKAKGRQVKEKHERKISKKKNNGKTTRGLLARSHAKSVAGKHPKGKRTNK